MQAFLDIFDIYLLEAAINGILFGGVLALLALGLNLIFGVIDVTWICYAELIMIGMYGMYYLVSVYGVPYWVAAPMCILLVAGLGALLHFLVIAPLLSSPPINQLLATGGVLFFLQSAATVAFGIEFHNIGIQLPVLRFGAPTVADPERVLQYARAVSPNAAFQSVGNSGLQTAMDGERMVAYIHPVTGESRVFPLLESLKPGQGLRDKAYAMAARMAADEELFPKDDTRMVALPAVAKLLNTVPPKELFVIVAFIAELKLLKTNIEPD